MTINLTKHLLYTNYTMLSLKMQVNFTCYFKYIIHKKYNVRCYYTIFIGVNNKMFKIRKPSASNKTIRMPDTLIEKLEKLASKHDISFNQLVVQCCEYALDNMNDEKPSETENK